MTSDQTMDLQFHSATASDIDDLLLLAEEFYREECLRFDKSSIGSALSELLSNAALGRIWLLQVDRHPIGYLILLNGFIIEFGGRHVFIDELYIRPGWRGRGLGRKTLQFAESVCREAGINVIRLEVDRSNKRVIGLYQEFGFMLHERFTMTRILD